MLVEGQWRKVLAISVFERTISDEEAAEHTKQPDAEGWLTRIRD
jgi:hypothetical protein